MFFLIRERGTKREAADNEYFFLFLQTYRERKYKAYISRNN